MLQLYWKLFQTVGGVVSCVEDGFCDLDPCHSGDCNPTEGNCDCDFDAFGLHCSRILEGCFFTSCKNGGVCNVDTGACNCAGTGYEGKEERETFCGCIPWMNLTCISYISINIHFSIQFFFFFLFFFGVGVGEGSWGEKEGVVDDRSLPIIKIYMNKIKILTI